MFPAMSQRAGTAILRSMLRLALLPSREWLFLVGILMGLVLSIAVQIRPVLGLAL